MASSTVRPLCEGGGVVEIVITSSSSEWVGEGGQYWGGGGLGRAWADVKDPDGASIDEFEVGEHGGSGKHGPDTELGEPGREIELREPGGETVVRENGGEGGRWGSLTISLSSHSSV